MKAAFGLLQVLGYFAFGFLAFIALILITAGVIRLAEML